MKNNLLILYVNQLDDIQQLRIRTSNRLKIKKDGSEQKNSELIISDEEKLYFDSLMNDFELREKEILKKIKNVLKTIPIYNEYLKGIKGVGNTLSAIMLSYFDIEIATTVSKMWAFAGLDPNKKLEKGKKAPYCKYLKSKLLGVLGSSFLKSKSNFSKIYYDVKHRLESEHRTEINGKEWSKMHIHLYANRKMVKQFLLDFYLAWREIEGLPIRKPYAEEYLNKKHSA